METIRLEAFVDRIGQSFVFQLSDGQERSLRLERVTELPRPMKADGTPLNPRESFSLVLLGDANYIPQATYPVSHPDFGELALFIVPVGKKPEGYEYEAVFN